MADQEDLDALWQTAKPVDQAPAPKPAGPPTLAPDLLDVPVGGPITGNTGTPGPGFLPTAAEMGGKAVRTFGPPVLEIGGSIIGARAMAPVQGARAAWNLGRAAFGAGAGAMAGTAVNETLMPQQAGTPPPTVSGTLDKMKTSFLGGAAGEVGGAGITAGLNKVRATKLGRPFADSVTPEGLAAENVLGGTVTGSQVADSRGASLIDNILGSTIFGGNKYRKVLADQRVKLHKLTEDTLNRFRTAGQAPATAEDAGKAIQAGADAAAAPIDAQAKAAYGVAGSAAEQATAARTGMIDSVGGLRTREAAGKAWQEAQEAAHTAARDTASAMYDTVDTLAEGVGVPIVSLREFVEQEANRRGRLGMALAPGQVKQTGAAVMHSTAPEGAEAAIPEGMEHVQRALQNAAEAGGTAGSKRSAELLGELQAAMADAPSLTADAAETGILTFRQAHEVRSALGRRLRAAERSNDPNAKNSVGFLRQLYKRIDDEMMKSAGEVPGEAVTTPLATAYRQATGMWKEMAQDFEAGILDDIAGKDPRLIMDAFMKPGSVDDILLAKKKVGPQAWSHIQGAALDDIFKGKDGWATGKEIQTKLRDLTPETIDAMFGKGGRGRIDQYLKETMASSAMAETGAKLSGQAAKMRSDIPAAYRAMSDAIKPGMIEDVEKLQQIVGPQHWKTVKAAKAEEIFRGKGGKDATGEEILGKLHQMTPETVRAMFGRIDADQLFLVGRVIKQVQRKQPGTLSWLVPTAQVSAGLGLGSGILTGDMPSPKTAAYGLTVLLGPSALAKIALSPNGRKWLTTGLTARAAGDTGAATRAFTQLTSWMVKEGLIDPHRPATTPGPATPTIDAPRSTGRGGGPGPGAGSPPPSTDLLDVPVGAPPQAPAR